MTPDRRHEEHPHPPPGCPEQRSCSGDECRGSREEWFKQSLLPQLRADFIKIIIATVLTLWAAISYTTHTQIMGHELQGSRRSYIQRFELRRLRAVTDCVRAKLFG